MDQVIFRTVFCANLEYLFKSHKPVSNYRPTNDIFDLSITFSFPFDNLYFTYRLLQMERRFHFLGKKVLLFI